MSELITNTNISDQQSLDYFSTLTDILILSTAIISTLISLLIPCLFYLKKQCQQHPTVLIANISLLESIANFNIVLMAINIFSYESFIHITNIFHNLTFDLIQLDNKEDVDFCISNFCVYMLVQLLSISFHICYSIDLFITIKFPFFTGKKRRKYYYIFAIILPLVTLVNSFQQADQICQYQLAKESIYKVPFGFLITLVLFCAISVAIVIMSFFQKSRSKIRRDYIHHHRFILILLVMFWIAPIWSNILIRLDREDDPYFDLLNKISFFCIIASTGIINIVRMVYDKFLRQKIFDMVCLKSKNNDPINQQIEQQHEITQKVNDQVWNLPLSQAMNQYQSQQIVNYIIQVVCQACSAHKTKRNTMRQSNIRYSSNITERQSTMLYDSVFRNTVVIEQETDQTQKSLMNLFNKNQSHKYQKLSPHQATILDLKQLCKKKRRFNMVCMTPVEIEDESQSQRLTHKTVHIRGNLIKQQKIKKQQINLLLSIKVTSYSHRIFQCLRQYDGITQQSISESLDVLKNMDNIRKAKQSLGASGSFFFFSYDYKLVIKTIPQEEKNRFIQILPYYFDHIRSNQESLFARTYGIFSIEIQGISKIYFIMMENTFRNLQQAHVKYRIYDLKGSTVQRYVKKQDAQVLKDINYFKSGDCFIYMSKQNKIRLIDQIIKDIDMLRNHNIMDYSLLLAVGKSKCIKRYQNYNRQDRRITDCRYITQMEEVTKRIYSISIIDYLQQFNFNKKMELMLKKLFKGGGDISSIQTEKYYLRFINLLNRIILVLNPKFQQKGMNPKIVQTV